MAEISNASATGHKRGMRRSKKLSTRVDLTPMVDLGFLLITFFIFTTSMTTPKAVKLDLPAGDIPADNYGESTVLTIIPVADDKVFYYNGELANALKNNSYGITSFNGSNGIGDVIRQKQIALDHNRNYTRKDLLLLVKPAVDSRYSNVIAMLDEVLINDVKHYAFAGLDAAEKQGLQNLGIR